MTSVELVFSGKVYQVQIGSGGLDRAGEELAAIGFKGKCFLLGDSAVAFLEDRLRASFQSTGIGPVFHWFPAGEERKNLSTAAELYAFLAESRAERSHPIVGIGGGTAGDLVGFVASTYLRGVPFVQVPTTLLAMVDASVGGKVGVNLAAGKNLVGSFYQPAKVLVDTDVLTTLPPRELRAGLAECIKHALLSGDEFLAWTEQALEGDGLSKEALLEEFVAKNVAFKAQVVMRDERESGERAFLNLGHTFAHALETVTEYKVLLHGEAVGLGLIAALTLSERLGYRAGGALLRCRRLLEKAGLPTAMRLPDIDALMTAMTADKKVEGGLLRFVLLEAPGRPCIRSDVAGSAVVDAWKAIAE